MFQKAVKTKGKLRLALAGLAGAGKSKSALKIASAIQRLMRQHGHGEGKIAALDSERGSLSLYADQHDFDVVELDSFSPLTYVECIKAAERAGYDIIIVDSLSHAWAGKDGALEKKDSVAERDPRGNSWTAWRSVTPMHNALVDALVGSKAHVIATMRQKMEFVQETNEKGKTEIRKVGLASIQREGMEYEFTLVGDISIDHVMKVSKSRCDGFINVGDQFEKPGDAFTEKVYAWLMNGADSKPAPVRVQAPAPSSEQPAPANDTVASALDAAFVGYLAAIDNAQTLPDLDRAASSGEGKPAKGTANAATAGAHYHARKAWIEQQAKAGAA